MTLTKGQRRVAEGIALRLVAEDQAFGYQDALKNANEAGMLCDASAALLPRETHDALVAHAYAIAAKAKSDRFTRWGVPRETAA